MKTDSVTAEKSLSAWLNESIAARWTAPQLIGLLLIVALACTGIWNAVKLPGMALNPVIQQEDSTTSSDPKKSALEKDIQKLETRLAALTPRSAYLIVNTSQNNFRLYKNNELITEGKCSTGSYIMLQNGDQQTWTFKTPKGEFRIQGKNRAPVWKKPDWAFVEEGLPIPSTNHSSRYVYGVLGDYSLSLGRGYLIHGTLYKRFLGLPVTHGCIRMNDDDLKATYRALSVGSKVYIF